MSTHEDEELPFGLDDMLEPGYEDNLLLRMFLEDDNLRRLLFRYVRPIPNNSKSQEGHDHSVVEYPE